MKTLAHVIVYLLDALSTGDEDLDSQTCGDIINDAWFTLCNASPEERKALADAASARLQELLREPDEYGYTPRDLVTPHQREVLQELADGTVWDQYDHADADQE